MRIRRMDVNGFGIHRERSFDLELDAQAIVFYGHNEAGKSTLMGFVRSILFGFPKRNNKLERYEPLSGGLHGGSITIVDPAGTEVRIERYESNGSLKLTYADGMEAGEAALQSLLGGLTAQLYRNLFAFSLSELQQIDTLHAEEISGFLFSAGMGISGTMMLQAERKLTQQMEQLYKRGGTKQSINEQLRKLEHSEQELRASKEKSGKFEQWRDQLDGLEQIILSDENELTMLRGKSEWIHKCMQSRDSWVQLLEIESELRELPQFIDFPEHVLERFEQAQENLDRINLELHSIQKSLVDATEQLNPLIVNHKLIEHKAALEQLLEAAVVYTDSTVGIAEHTAEVEGVRLQLHRYLRLISADWTEEQLLQFPLSIHYQEQVSAFAERFEAYTKRRQARMLDHERLVEQAEQYRDSKRHLHQIQQVIMNSIDGQPSSLDEIGLEQLHAYESEVVKLWEQTKKFSSDLIHVEERLSDAVRNEHLLRPRRGAEQLGGGKRKLPNIGVILLAITLNIGLPLWVIVVLDNMFTGIVIFLLISFLQGYIWLRKDNSTARPEVDNSLYTEATKHREHMEQEAQHVRSLWDEALRHLYDKLSLFSTTSHIHHAAEAAASRGLGEVSEHTSIMEAIQQLNPLVESVLQQLSTYKQAKIDLQANNNQLDAVTQDLLQLEQRIDNMMELDSNDQQAEATCKQEWISWLEQHQLPLELSVESMNSMFQYAEAGLQLLDQITRINKRLAVYAQSQLSFERDAVQFLEQHGVGLGHSLTSTQIIYELRKLKEQLEAQASIQENRKHMEQQVLELNNREQLCLTRISHLQDKLNELIECVQATNEQELRKKVRLYERRVELEKSKRHLEIVIFTWVKQEQQRQLFLTLEQYDMVQLDQQLTTVHEEMKQVEHRLNESKDRRGGLRKEMEDLQAGGQHAELLQRHQEHIAEYQHMASRWAELALSLELIRRAKEIYERERQPGVLLRASQYMRMITDGQFVRVVSRIGEKTIFVQRDNGQQLDSTYLSRGTAEQLYLAMRFALADEYSKTVALPIIMDDIFVNFDADRLARTLQVLSEVAHRHQIILFTCHEHVVTALQSALSRVQLIHLELGVAGK